MEGEQERGPHGAANADIERQAKNLSTGGSSNRAGRIIGSIVNYQYCRPGYGLSHRLDNPAHGRFLVQRWDRYQYRVAFRHD